MPPSLLGKEERSRDYDTSNTMRAWEDFLTRGEIPRRQANDVRSIIRESWQRSATLGINAEGREAPITQANDEIEELRRSNRELVAASEEPFRQMGRMLTDTGAMLLLTDRNGTIIDTIGDPTTLEKGRRIHLEVGGTWNETAVGTNGIGTAIWTGKPVFVHAAEHFCAGIKNWTCAGAPICDPMDQSVIGVLDLSGPPEIFQRHNTALVASAAREIQEALAERQKEERARLLEAFIESSPARGTEDGILILDRFGRVVYNRAAVGALSGQPSDDSLAFGKRLIGLSENMTDADIAALLPPELRLRDVSPLRLNGEFRGVALLLPRKRDGAPIQRSTPATGSPPIRRADNDAPVIVGKSERLLEAIELARRVAKANVSALIQGDTGVGKELFARLINSESRRTPSAPFIPVNCGAISKELFGGELFGYVAGAFTGATREGKPGKFEQSDGGVLCLDEIGEMPLDIQPYLLRVVEERVVYRIGCSKPRPVDVRLVAMTNRDLKREVEAGRFRRDLYYRIGALTIHVPPLRERGEDIVLLAEHFARQISRESGREQLRFSDAALQLMLSYSWPGNVRELRNMIERLDLLVHGRDIRPSDLPMELAEEEIAHDSTGTAERDGGSLEDAERLAIKRAIVAENGNMTKVAQVLGISRPTLYRKIKLYEIRRFYE